VEQAIIERPTTEVAQVPTSVLEAMKPFDPNDGTKGTFLVMRIAGLEQGTALKLVNRKYRTYLEWKSSDPYFKALDEQLPDLTAKFGGEARVIRTALLDIEIIESGIMIFRKILKKEPMSDGMWSYAVKMAGIRLPMMLSKSEAGSPWERLANSIKSTLEQRDITVREELDGSRSIMASETIIRPTEEQTQLASDIVRGILQGGAEAE
jgi:hypothetical protein